MIGRLYQPGDRSSHLGAGQSQSVEIGGGGQRGGRPGRGSAALFDAPETESRKGEMVSG